MLCCVYNWVDAAVAQEDHTSKQQETVVVRNEEGHAVRGYADEESTNCHKEIFGDLELLSNEAIQETGTQDGSAV